MADKSVEGRAALADCLAFVACLACAGLGAALLVASDSAGLAFHGLLLLVASLVALGCVVEFSFDSLRQLPTGYMDGPQSRGHRRADLRHRRLCGGRCHTLNDTDPPHVRLPSLRRGGSQLTIASLALRRFDVAQVRSRPGSPPYHRDGDGTRRLRRRRRANRFSVCGRRAKRRKGDPRGPKRMGELPCRLSVR